MRGATRHRPSPHRWPARAARCRRAGRWQDPQVRAQQRTQFLKNLGLLGGLLLAAVDTEGRPGLAYRAHMVSDSAHRTARQTRREARHLAHAAAREAKLKAVQAQHAIG